MKWKTTLVLAALALPGVLAASWLALPLLVDTAAVPVPLAAVQVASAVQGILLVLLAAAAGSILGPKVGLGAPVVTAFLARQSVADACRPRLWPGVLGGAMGALVIVAFNALSPPLLAELQRGTSVPMAVRLLYGGITEEVLVRWGLMTVLVWAGWRVLQRGVGRPSAVVAGTAILVSALLFGLAHVPLAASLLTEVPAALVAYITIGNALFGVVAGYLFWRYGLESAIAAHVLAHLIAAAVPG